MRRVAAVLAAALVAAVAPTLARVHADSAIHCSGDPRQVLPLSVAVNGRPDGGLYVVPARQPHGLVVFSHGFEASPTRYPTAMRDLATRAGVIALALYNPGETLLNGGVNTRGWRVREGALAGIAAAQLFARSCPGIARGVIVDYGTSMGGNTSGLIAAAGAKRSGGRPLFDYWFDVEGATNVIETYLEAHPVAATGNSYAARAIASIEQENGGRTLAQDPAAFEDLAVITHAKQIAASGLRGVVLVHGVGDGLVPYDQSREMEAMLIRFGVPTDFYTAVTRAPGTEPGTTLDQYLPVHHMSPFAGHGGEGDESHTVTGTAIRLMTELLLGQVHLSACHREFLVDGTLHTVQPVREGCLAPS